jgi:hypothetical protein
MTENPIKLFRTYKYDKKTLKNLDYKGEPFLALTSKRYGGFNPEGVRDFLCLVSGISCLSMSLYVFLFWR